MIKLHSNSRAGFLPLKKTAITFCGSKLLSTAAAVFVGLCGAGLLGQAVAQPVATSLNLGSTTTPVPATGVGTLIYNVATVVSGATSVKPGFYVWTGTEWRPANTQYFNANSTAANSNAQATGSESVAIGSGSVASGANNFAAGKNAAASGSNAIAIGVESRATGVGGVGSVAIGGGDITIPARTNTANRAGTAVGFGSQASGAGDGAGSAFGTYAKANGGSYNTAVGYAADASSAGPGAALPLNPDFSGAISVGAFSRATSPGSTALGSQATASVPGGVALGNFSIANRAAGSIGFPLFVPVGATAASITAITATNSTVLGAVSVGSVAQGTRQIINVAAGSSDTDAVNVSQLKALSAVVAALPAGAAGAAGAQGLTGAAGPQGPAGPTGSASTVPGPVGPQGPAGTNGAPGTPGAAGTAGATGAQGPAGAAGQQGPAGPTGPASTVPGPVGPQGPQGPAGTGGAGNNTPGTPGQTGAQGPAGPTGAIGPQGPAGSNGAPGTPGQFGATVPVPVASPEKWAIGLPSDYTAPLAIGLNSTAVGSGASATTPDSIALGHLSTTSAAVATPSIAVNGTNYRVAGALPTGVLSVGAPNAERQISNVAAGQVGAASTDAVNGSQLFAANQAIAEANKGLSLSVNNAPANRIAPGSTLGVVNGTNTAATFDPASNQLSVSTVPSPTFTTVTATNLSIDPGGSIAMGNNPVTQVAAGVAPTDAANVGQLASATAQARQYTDARVNQFQEEVVVVQKDAHAGAAVAMAMSSMPQAFAPGKNMLSAGAASYQGQSAVAIGFSRLSESGKWMLKINGAANTRGKVGVGVGVGFGW